jgi:hypothetical protein
MVALLASGVVSAANGLPPGKSATSAATAVTLPSAVVTDRANVSTDLAAVATTKAALVAAVAAGDATAIQAASAAYQTARIQLDADMQKLRDDALPIARHDQSNLDDDRILLEIYKLTNNADAYATARKQLDADHAQAAANRSAIFGNLCPSGYICDDLPGPWSGPGPGQGPDGPRHAREART